MTLIGAQRRLPALLTCAILLTTLGLATACGSSNDGGNQPSPTEAWAGRVCSTAGNWLGTVKDAKATLSDTKNLSAESLRKAVDDVAGATETLVTNLGKVGAPQTKAGDQAQAQLSSLSDQLAQQQSVISKATDQPAGGVQALLTQVSTVTGAVATMLSDIATTVDHLRQLQGADELQKAFQDATACQDLRASASAAESSAA